MIPVTRLNGSVFALNPDLVLRADATPDTVLTLVDGTKYVITESLDDFMGLVLHHRADVVRAAMVLTDAPFRHLSADLRDVEDDDEPLPAVVPLRPRRA